MRGEAQHLVLSPPLYDILNTQQLADRRATVSQQRSSGGQRYKKTILEGLRGVELSNNNI